MTENQKLVVDYFAIQKQGKKKIKTTEDRTKEFLGLQEAIPLTFQETQELNAIFHDLKEKHGSSNSYEEAYDEVLESFCLNKIEEKCA